MVAHSLRDFTSQIYYPRLWGWQHHTEHHGCMQACIYDGGGGASAAPCTWGCMFGIEYNGLPSCLRHLLVIAYTSSLTKILSTSQHGSLGVPRF